jgi:fucose permease
MMDRLQPTEILAGCSSLLLMHGVGAAIGPVVAGGLMHHFGPVALTAWFAAVELLLGMSAWYLSRQTPADIAHQTSFTAMIRTSPTALEMLDATHATEPAQAMPKAP